VSDLPAGWTRTSIGDVTLPFVSIDPNKQPSQCFTYIDIGSIDNERQKINKPKSFDGADAPSRARRLVRAGDVLFSTVRTYLKNIALVPPELDGALTSTGIAVLRASEAVDTRYLFNWVCSAAFIEEVSKSQDGTMYPAVSDKDVTAAQIALPPLAEQRRIVAQLDRLMVRMARARAELARIPALIAQHKRAILAAAFDGKWFAAPAPVVSVGEIADISSGFGFPKDRQGRREGRYPFAKVSDISRAVEEANGVLRTAANFVEEEDLRSLRAKAVSAGSIVFAKIGEALRLNRRAITEVSLVLDNNCMALTPSTERVLPKYLFWFMRTVDLSPFAVATAVPSVRRGDVAALELSLPALPVQRDVVERIEAAFAWLDKVGHEHAQATRLLDHLDQALLAKAFRGELVPQDPTDEPAEVLLARIRAGRGAADTAARKRKALR